MTKARDNSAGRLNAESVNGLMVGSFKNRLLNPNFAINQRGAATLVGSGYFVDRWRVAQSGSTQTYGVGSPSTLSDTGYSHLYMQTTAVKASLAAGDYNFMGQSIEGFNVSDFKWGSAAAEPATLSFKAQASQANTVMSVCIRNADGNRSYVTTVVLQTGLQEYSITIPGDTAGTWNKNSLGGIDIGFTFAAASSGAYTTAVKDAWQAGNYLAHSTQSNCLDTLNRTVSIADVQFERGTRKTKFEVRPYALELLMCQRYFEVSYPGTKYTFNGAQLAVARSAWILAGGTVQFRSTKRTYPTMSLFSPNDAAAGVCAEMSPGSVYQGNRSAGFIYVGPSGATAQVAGTATADYQYVFHWEASAEL